MSEETIETAVSEITAVEVAPEVAPAGTIEMIRPADGRINHVAPENVQDYLDSGLWHVVN